MTRQAVELAGPAGAGKTTLAAALRRQEPRTKVGVDVGRLRVAAALVSAAPTLAAARLSARGRSWTSAELRSIGYLGAWRAPITGRQDDDLLLLDHGPVYRLSSLAAYGPPMVHTASFRHWWRRTGVEWARILDTVVWLDAADTVLLTRIDRRDRGHRIQGAQRAEAEAFLSRYRRAYRMTLDLLASEGTRIVSVDTSASSPEELAALVQAFLDESRTGRPG